VATTAGARTLALFHHDPRPSDLVLTIDRRIHDAAVGALGKSDGAIVAIDPRSGAVLAMVSKPYFDPNASDDHLAKLQSDPTQPLFNRAYDAGPYRREIDYAKDKITPRLRAEQAKWAAGLTKAVSSH